MNINSVQLLGVEYAIFALSLYLGLKCLFLNTVTMKYYIRFMVSSFLLSVINIPVRLAELALMHWSRDFVFWLYAIENILITFCFAYWCLFLLNQADSFLTSTRTRVHLLLIPAFAEVILSVANYWTQWLYVIDENSLYSRGEYFVLQTALGYGYLLLFFSCLLLGKLKKADYTAMIKYYISVIQVVFFSVLQMIFGGSFLILGIVLGSLITYIEVCVDRQNTLEMAKETRKHELYAKELKELFVQTADALASAIDAKDKYTSGHSRRVAEYSREIAKLAGYSESECESVYYAGLLHDVGKIGVPDVIIGKNGKLTDDEYDAIKQHPVFGNTILEKISQLPYLSVGANFHHERYDGKGYPMGLKGVEIPEMARIIAVADAYDAMTSCRSYRSPMAQQKVREELVKGLGSQFDPEFGHCMIHILDLDVEYRLKDTQQALREFAEEYEFGGFQESYTDGISIAEQLTRISFSYEPLMDDDTCVPKIIVFDSLDSVVYNDDYLRDKMDYTGFFDIALDGVVKKYYIRDFHVKEVPNEMGGAMAENEVVIETARQKDHLLIRVILSDVVREYIIAMWDRSQFAYTAFTGTNCKVRDFRIEKESFPVGEDYIERIAEEISYIKDRPEGDLENIEIAGWREKHSKGVEIKDKMVLTFHAMSLPAARRMWHCPYIAVYTSEDGTINGEGYQEISLIRLDGERWEDCELAKNKLNVIKDDSFVSWDEWKKANREGVDCSVYFERNAERINVMAEDFGVHVENTLTFTRPVDKVYFALTGDQVALTDIHVN